MKVTHILLASLMGTAAISGAQAAGAGKPQAVFSVQSAPVYPGANGATAVLVLQYDKIATIPLTIRQVRIGDLLNLGQQQTLDNCGTPTPSGYVLNPGQHCFLQSARTNNDSLYGAVVMTDGTKNTDNMTKTVRAMLEIRDSNNNVLTHAELR